MIITITQRHAELAPGTLQSRWSKVKSTLKYVWKWDLFLFFCVSVGFSCPYPSLCQFLLSVPPTLSLALYLYPSRTVKVLNLPVHFFFHFPCLSLCLCLSFWLWLSLFPSHILSSNSSLSNLNRCISFHAVVKLRLSFLFRLSVSLSLSRYLSLPTWVDAFHP